MLDVAMQRVRVDSSLGDALVDDDLLVQRIQGARERYADLYVARAGVQAIPWVGGSLDTLIAGGVARIQLQRVEDFLCKLDDRMRQVESVSANLRDEGLSDLMVETFTGVTRSRSDAKRARFARILAKQIENGREWDEAERAVRLLSELDDIHVDVLRTVIGAPVIGEPFGGQRIVALEDRRGPDDQREPPLVLGEALTNHTLAALRMACAELVARGLLHDEGIGRLGAKALNLFVITDLGEWFTEWLAGD